MKASELPDNCCCIDFLENVSLAYMHADGMCPHFLLPWNDGTWIDFEKKKHKSNKKFMLLVQSFKTF